jgi:hypothetical protein
MNGLEASIGPQRYQLPLQTLPGDIKRGLDVLTMCCVAAKSDNSSIGIKSSLRRILIFRCLVPRLLPLREDRLIFSDQCRHDAACDIRGEVDLSIQLRAAQ